MTILYKYRSVTPYTAPMLKEGTIWAATPGTLNDPHETRAEIFTSYIDGIEALEKRQLLATYMLALEHAKGRPTFFGLSGKHKKKFEQDIRNARPDAIDYLLDLFERARKSAPISWEPSSIKDTIQALKRTLAGIGVISLAEEIGNALMWAHYANSHTGFCLGFEYDGNTALSQGYTCGAVQYSQFYPALAIDKLEMQANINIDLAHKTARRDLSFDITNPVLYDIIHTKSQEWSYEKEWRVVGPRGDLAIPYPLPLKEIVFG
ncbi:MAG TPA: DUF2971 domain-containing protein, partial [Noviherbaspirillum sp.]